MLGKPCEPREGSISRPAILDDKFPVAVALLEYAADFLFDRLHPVLAEPNDGNEGIGRGARRSCRMQCHEVLNSGRAPACYSMDSPGLSLKMSCKSSVLRCLTQGIPTVKFRRPQNRHFWRISRPVV